VAAQGGLQAARPKQLLDGLQAEFPELTLQVVKWHLQGQRRAKQRSQQRAQQREGQLQRVSSADLSGLSNGVGSNGQQQQQARSGQASDGLPLAFSTVLGLQSPQGQQQEQWQAHQQQFQQQQQQQQAPPQQQRGVAVQRLAWTPWQAFLLPSAQENLDRSKQGTSLCRQVLARLQQQASHLGQLLQVLLNEAGGQSSGGEASTSAAGGGGSSDIRSPESAQLQQTIQELLGISFWGGGGQASTQQAYGSGGGPQGGAGGGGSSGGAPRVLPAHLQRQHRIMATVAATFPVMPEAAAAAAASSGPTAAAATAAAMQYQYQRQLGGSCGTGGASGASHNPATCTLPGCLRCAYEARLQQRRREVQQQRAQQQQ
jgi:hypothetical protein